MSRLGARRPEKQVADCEIQRVSVSRREVEFADRGLKEAGVAEIEAGEQRRPVERERDARDNDRSPESAMPGHTRAAVSVRASARRDHGSPRSAAC